MTLTKAKIAERLYLRQPNMSQQDAKRLTEEFFEVIKNHIVEDGGVKLSGFGNFTTRDKSPRPGRNPKTNEPHTIEARRVCTFKAGQKLRARCEDPVYVPSDIANDSE